MTCPICARASDKNHRPFCSKRCADLDLGNWLTGKYAVPSTQPEDIEAAVEAVAQKDLPEH